MFNFGTQVVYMSPRTKRNTTNIRHFQTWRKSLEFITCSILLSDVILRYFTFSQPTPFQLPTLPEYLCRRALIF